MTSLLDAPPSLVEALRATRRRRPLADRAHAAGLRAVLNDGIFAVTGGDHPHTPLVIHAGSLRPDVTSERHDSARSRLRGTLIGELLRLLSVGVHVDNPFVDACLAWRAQTPSPELLARLDGLDDDERARLRTDVEAHFVTLVRSFGAVPAQWQPRSALHVVQRLAGGDVVLRDHVDLMFGSANSLNASVTLLDLTSSPLGEGVERALRYHALVETLRTSTVPLRSAAFSSATGELWIREVDPELLTRAVEDVIAAIERAWALR